MHEITSIALENEMDLILIHRQCMKTVELAGMSIAAQTTFATAVSEIARLAIDSGHPASLVLYLGGQRGSGKKIRVSISSPCSFISAETEGYRYAKRLLDHITIQPGEPGIVATLEFHIPQSFRIDDTQIERWRIMLNTDPSVSPYEEIKRKNRQLTELSDRLKKSEDQYRTLTNSLPLMIFTLDENGHVIYANNWLLEYTGHTIEMLNNTRWSEVLHPDDTNAWTQDAALVPLTVERRFRNGRNNEYRWYTGIITPVTTENGELQYWTAYLADIHAQKTIEQALKDNKELKDTQELLTNNIAELNRSNQALQQFAYVASHDLQEPLRKISFYSDFLERNYHNALQDEGLKFIRNIVASTDRMRTLIHDILAYSTIKEDSATWSETPLDAVAAEAIEDLEIAILEKQATIQVDPLPAIRGNRNQLKQIFENLISNSLKYIYPDTLPQIHIFATLGNGMLQIHFRDNGIGFDEKYLDKMFALFQRLHGRNEYLGAGIGLSICKKIVEIHGGTITAESRPGKGATFILSFPAGN